MSQLRCALLQLMHAEATCPLDFRPDRAGATSARLEATGMLELMLRRPPAWYAVGIGVDGSKGPAGANGETYRAGANGGGGAD